MSFQDQRSDISILNSSAHLHPVRVDPRTYEVLRHAADISQRSGGAFDITVAPYASPDWNERASTFADPLARWSDVKLLPDCHVAFERPLGIDVSGIAKGYAVDRAMDLLLEAHPEQAYVDAGGDLSVRGTRAEAIWLDVEPKDGTTLPVVQLRDGCLASSGTRSRPLDPLSPSKVAHFDGITRCPAPLRFVSVVASTCVVADALTKIVMSLGLHSAQILRLFSARALLSDSANWLEVA